MDEPNSISLTREVVIVPVNEGETAEKDLESRNDEIDDTESEFNDNATAEYILDPLLICSGCESNLNSKNGVFKICSHPLLFVPMCIPCLETYTEEHGKVEDINEVCAWCLNGGELLECGDEECGHCFCAECITRWLGIEVLDVIKTDDEWRCFICQPSPTLDKLTSARENGYIASLYNDLYFESERFNEWTLARTEERDGSEFQIKEEEIIKVGEFFDLILSETNKANYILEDDASLRRKRTEIAAELGDDTEKVDTEMKIFIEQWQTHVDILTRQHDQLVEWMDLVGIDSDHIRKEVDERWNKCLRDRNPDLARLELENEQRASIVVTNAPTARNGNSTNTTQAVVQREGPTDKYNPEDLFTDWDGYEEEEAMNGHRFSPRFSEEIVNADPFVIMYSDKPAVPHNRYPKIFEKHVPREILRGIYYRRMHRAQPATDEAIHFEKAMKKFKVPWHIQKVVYYAGRFVPSSRILKKEFAHDVHPAITKTFLIADMDPDDVCVLGDSFGLDPSYFAVEDLGDGHVEEWLNRAVNIEKRTLLISTDIGDVIDAADREAVAMEVNNKRRAHVNKFEILRTVLDDKDNLEVLRKTRKAHKQFKVGKAFIRRYKRRAAKRTTADGDDDGYDDGVTPVQLQTSSSNVRRMSSVSFADDDDNNDDDGEIELPDEENPNKSSDSDSDLVSLESEEHEISRLVASKRSTPPSRTPTQKKASSSSSSSSLPPRKVNNDPQEQLISSLTTSEQEVSPVVSNPVPSKESNTSMTDIIIDLTNDDDDDDVIVTTGSSARKQPTGTLAHFFTQPKTPGSSSSSANQPKYASTTKKSSVTAASNQSSMMLSRVYNYSSLQSTDHLIAENAAKVEFNSEAPKPYVINRTSVDDRRNKDPVVIVPLSLQGRLKNHQLEAQVFLWNNIVKTFSTLKLKGTAMPGDVGGCLISHCMGLGKTLTVIAFSITLLACPSISSLRHSGATSRKSTNKSTAPDIESSQQSQPSVHDSTSAPASPIPASLARKYIQCILVLAPVNTLENWKNEYANWTPAALSKLVRVYSVASHEKKQKRFETIQHWYNRGGVLIMGHDMFKLLLKSSASVSATATATMTEWLLEGPDVVVIDEAHVMKAKRSDICVAVSKIKTKRRIALTGSPLQNNLLEYYVMVNWIRKGHISSTEANFRRMFMNPIKAGESKDATEAVKKHMNRRSHVLHKKLSHIVDRKDITTLEKDLRPKREFVILIRMSPFQKYLYKRFLELDTTKNTGASKLFAVYQGLLRLWNHPGVTVLKSLQLDAKVEDEANKQQELQRSTGKKQKRITPVVSEIAKLKNLATPIDRLRRELLKPVRAFEGLAEEARVVDLSELGLLTEEEKEAEEENDDDEEDEQVEREGDGNDDDIVSDDDDDNELENAAAHFQSAYEELLDGEAVTSNGVAKDAQSDSPGSLQIQLLEDDDDDDDDDDEDDKSSDHKRLRVGNHDATMSKDDFVVEATGIAALETTEAKTERSRSTSDESASIEPTHWPHEGVYDINDTPIAPINDWMELLSSVNNADKPTELNQLPLLTGNEVDAIPVADDQDEDDGAADDNSNEDMELAPELKHYWKLEHLYDAASSSSSSSSATIQASESLTDQEFLLLGNKLFVLLAILKAAIDAGDKILVFSSSIPTLDLIEHFLKLKDWGDLLPTSPVSSGFLFSKWSLGKQYARIDGTFDSDRRLKQIDAFNDKRSNNHHKVFLLSTKAANMGINLQSANRVILVDSSWNPAVDLQAIFRCYRYGQTKPVFVYRLVAHGSMEEKVYRKQVDKQALSSRVVDAKTPESHFNKAEMEKLMVFEDDNGAVAAIEEFETILSTGSSDEVLRQLLRPLNERDMIASILDQGSLLKDNEEAHLSVEEKKQADEEYEAEENATKPRIPTIPQMLPPTQPDPYSAVGANNLPLPYQLTPSISSNQYPPGHYLSGQSQSLQQPSGQYQLAQYPFSQMIASSQKPFLPAMTGQKQAFTNNYPSSTRAAPNPYEPLAQPGPSAQSAVLEPTGWMPTPLPYRSYPVGNNSLQVLYPSQGGANTESIDKR